MMTDGDLVCCRVTSVFQEERSFLLRHYWYRDCKDWLVATRYLGENRLI